MPGEKKLIVVGQNETARVTAAQEDTFLATLGLFGCVAFIVKDKNGNVSLTHVDRCTNLDFIQEEVASMQGPYTIDIVRQEPSQSQLHLKVLAELNKLGLHKTPTLKPHGRVKVTHTHACLVMGRRLQYPTTEQLEEILTPGRIPAQSNPLKTFKSARMALLDPAKYQLRTYRRQLDCLFANNPKAKPLLVFDASGWLNTEEPGLAAEVKEFIRGTPQGHEGERVRAHPKMQPAQLLTSFDGNYRLFADNSEKIAKGIQLVTRYLSQLRSLARVAVMTRNSGTDHKAPNQ